MRYIYFLVLLMLISFSSCEVINPDEDIPTFIKVDSMSFSVTTPTPNQGTVVQEIIDSWVYVDGDLIGTFEMPFVIPALHSGEHTVMIRPGIKVNGIASTRSVNPFMTNYVTTANLVAGDTISFQPTSGYYEYVEFPWIENFQKSGISIDSITSSSTAMTKTSDEAFEGTYSGQIHLDAGHQTYYGQSASEFTLPKSGKSVIMEIHVKNNSPLTIGLFSYLAGGTVGSIDHLIINEGDDWKKIYVNLSEIVSQQINALTYRIYFKASLGTATEADIYIDNIKLMHSGN